MNHLLDFKIITIERSDVRENAMFCSPKDLRHINITWKMSGMFLWSINRDTTQYLSTFTNTRAKMCKLHKASHLAFGLCNFPHL